MRLTTEAFDAYLGLARAGRTGIGAIVAGTILLCLLWLAGMVLTVLLAASVVAIVSPQWPTWPQGFFDGILGGRHGIFVLMLTIATLWPAVWLVVRLVQRRPFAGILGFERRLRRSEFGRGLAAALLVSILWFPLWIAIDPDLQRTDMNAGLWLAWIGPLALVILLQASAEELAFRGYLVQILAARFRSAWVWAALPALAFTLGHWETDASAWMNGAVFVAIGAFAVAMILLLVRTGSLAAPMGAHFGFNLVALPFVSIDEDGPESFGLWWSRPLSDPSWTAGDAVAMAVVGVVEAAAILALLLHPKSPLRLPEPVLPEVDAAGEG